MDLLRHLHFFAAVADARHFGDAARDLGMTQPPLSQGIQRLEMRLGIRLFDRDARGVRITPAGQSLLPHARELLRLEGEFDDLAAGLAVSTQIRLGLAGDIDDLIDGVVGALASTGHETAPTVAGSVELVDLLRDGALDVAVLRHPGIVDGLEAGPVLVVHTRWEPSGADAKSSLPVAVPPRHHQPPAHDQLIDALRRAGHRGSVVEAHDIAQRRAMTAARNTVRLAPVAAAASADVDAPPLRLRIATPLPKNQRSDIDYPVAVAVLTAALAR
ncbi:hypothetical protein GCM10025760_09840 [Microbacterium yannicii]|uniref:HTH lysR-type domain-containing protein n=1 Tax=Microbacterium yannicii TaxID=671622 RepID=A0ABP9M2C6_9MICO|nr:LysR family transcriptional regulator [Microbacterium yannicii]MCO5954424.1 LysR family transcriptional regulator [Microbacterium yannicii]